MELKCSLEERTSKKGDPYEVIVIKLTDTCEKTVFLEPAEKELLKLYSKSNSDMPSLEKEFFE